MIEVRWPFGLVSRTAHIERVCALEVQAGMGNQAADRWIY